MKYAMVYPTSKFELEKKNNHHNSSLLNLTQFSKGNEQVKSKFEVEKIQSLLHFPLKPGAVFKRQ